MDHDPLQAFLCKSVLEQRFQGVQRVSDAAEALCLVEQQRIASDIGLVITGRHMPGIGGPEFVAELLRRLPELPVLVLSSGGETAGDYPGDSVCFRKRPVPSDELLTLAGQMLSKHHQTTA